MWSKIYSKCMMPKQKAYSSKKYKKFRGIATQKLSCIDQKVWKMEAKWKALNHWFCANFVWLDWIDHWNFIINYGLVHTWFTHTTHKSNVQWMPISFVWLYVFKCDMYILNCLMIKPKKIFKCFICFWKCFCVSLLFWKFFQKTKFCFVEELLKKHFWEYVASKVSHTLVVKMRKQISFLPKFYTESFTTA